MLILIAAVNKKNTLGLDGSMPWHCPEDWKFFKRMTMGQKLIMGRKTYQGLPKVLKGRDILQVSRKEGPIHDLDSYLKDYKNEQDLFIAGGGEIYNMAMPYADKIYLSIINDDTMGDTFFPEIPSAFKLKDKIPFETFVLEIYERNE